MVQTRSIETTEVPRDLKQGDVTEWYTVLADGRQTSAGFRVRVRYNDGGTGERCFDRPDEGPLKVTRVVHARLDPELEDAHCAACHRHEDQSRECTPGHDCPHWEDRIEERVARWKAEEACRA